jgi:hypothetical protein
VCVLQLRDELDFATEAIGADAGRGFARQDFDDDIAVEREIAGDEHARHPTAAEFAVDAIGVAERALERISERVAHRLTPESHSTSDRSASACGHTIESNLPVRCSPEPAGRRAGIQCRVIKLRYAVVAGH